MHGGDFHFDAFVVFLLIGFLVAMVLRIVVHRLIRWMRHVNYMRKLAGGTLIVDAEANYWRELINDPEYVPQWRWSRGEQWSKQRGKMYIEGKRSLARKIGYVNIVLVIVILAIVTMPYLGGFFGGLGARPVVQTKQTVLGTGNLTLDQWNEYTGYAFELNGTTYLRPLDDPYLSGVALLYVRLERTDRAYADASVFVNVTSGTFLLNGTDTPYISYVHWVISNRTGGIDEFDNTGQDRQFGMSVNVPGRGYTEYLVVLYFRQFDPFYYEKYVEVSSYGSDGGSDIRIYGGYRSIVVR